MPKVATSQQLQKEYRSIFDDVIKTHEPVVILNRNHPEVVIVDVKTYQLLRENNEKYELEKAMEAVKNYENEKKSGKLKKLKSLGDL